MGSVDDTPTMPGATRDTTALDVDALPSAQPATRPSEPVPVPPAVFAEPAAPPRFRDGPVTAPPPGYEMSRLKWLPISMVRPDPENARGEVGDLTDLVADMRERGLIAPIEVRTTPEDPDGDFVVTAGHRRRAAAERLGWTHIECVIRGPMPRVEVLERMVAENGQREPLNPLDEAQAFRAIFQARKLGSTAQLAHRVGRSVSYVAGRLALLDLPPAEQARLRAGDMTVMEATRTAREVSGRTRASRTPAKPTQRETVRAAVARALRAEAQAVRALGRRTGGEGYVVAAQFLETRADDIEAGHRPLS
jgi:ParB family chromosome partitioning protein